MYIDATLINGRIHVSERNKQGQRKISTHLPPYVYYYVDGDGLHTSIFGDKLKRKMFTAWNEFNRSLNYDRTAGKIIFESDISPVFRFLEERYSDDTPPLHVSFIDIESDKDPVKGYSSVTNPFTIINAITIYNKWQNQYYTLLVPPPTLTQQEARDLLADPGTDGFGSMTEENGFYICENEAELLMLFLEIIEDADILTGWNSEFYDLPYIIHRIRMTLGGEDSSIFETETGSKDEPMMPSEESIKWLSKLGLFGALPHIKFVDQYGSMVKTYTLSGRIHLDYLQIYQKFVLEELHSYALDFVLRKEVQQTKVPYSGSLDQLYRYDFRTFVAYNRQDVAGLNALDDKKKMIELANQMSHMAGVTFDKVLGSVVIIEQAILKKLHKNKRICFDKKEHNDKGGIPGAKVYNTIAGLFKWLSSYDFNSLYPTLIRLINISPEVIIGQFDLSRTEEKIRQYMEIAPDKKKASTWAWGHFTGTLEYHDIINGAETDQTLITEEGDEITLTAKEWKEELKNNNWSISGNGTVFDLSQEGIVAQCLSEWFSKRKSYQAKAKEAKKAMNEAKDEASKKELKDQFEYFDMLQSVFKVFLNATYGAYLNKFFRFYDIRLGRSVTLSGRVLLTHMWKEVCKAISGKYEIDPKVIITGDTDSVYITLDEYMKMNNIEATVKNTVKIADKFGAVINESIPPFADENFIVGPERGKIVKVAREVVARRGLFKDKKKRYALHVVDKEGNASDDLKIMGLEIKRSDTPKFIQEFLEKCIVEIVKNDADYFKVKQIVDDFRYNTYRKMPPWQCGAPGRVSKLAINAKKIAHYEDMIADGYIDVKKITTHRNVKSSNNTNKLIEMHEEKRWDYLKDGDKVLALYLKDNHYKMDSVAIKVEETYVPTWFQELPFDTAKTEEKLIDKKIENVFGEVLNWKFNPTTDYSEEVFEEVDFFA